MRRLLALFSVVIAAACRSPSAPEQRWLVLSLEDARRLARSWVFRRPGRGRTNGRLDRRYGSELTP